ncbi:M60 family metallopeptidase [Pseudomonas cichorii]|nr:M60 family metallopeptidase [Pseudomonas cichorii]MBX8565870.1 M60 family metallopeptidase [Pseudomonas cichorii]
MATLTAQPMHELIRKTLYSLIPLFFLISGFSATAADDAVYDDQETLMPSVASEKSSEVTQASASSVISETLIWRIRAAEIYGGGENTYNIPVLEDQGNEIQRLAGWQRRNIYIPTHVYLDPGDTVTLKPQEYPSTTTQCSAHIFPNFDKPYSAAETSKKLLYMFINNTYKSEISGMLMLACVDTGRNMNNWASWGKAVTITTSPPAKKTSLYLYGTTPPSDWPSIAKSPDPSGHVYLFNGRTVMDFPAAVAAHHADKNIDAMMLEHLIITSSYDRLNGLSWQVENPLDTQPFSMYQAGFKNCCSSSYFNGLISINFGGDRIVSHWGDWHEYGHQNQLGWKWNHLTEISNNLFSLEACKMLTGKKTGDFSRCHSRFGSYVSSDPESVGRFLATDGLPDIPESDADRTLMMLGQLYVSFPNWHAQFAKDFRAAYARGDNAADFSTEQKKIDWFVLNTSRIVGRDLRSFFDKWSLTYTATAREAIAALKLPEPIKPSIQHSADWTISANPVIEGVIPVPVLKHSLGLIAYDREEGPTSLQTTGEESYTRLTTLLVGSKRVPYPVVLRGTLKHGECPGEGPMHTIATCVGTDRNVYWKLTYNPIDNVLLPLPDDNYEGVLRLGIRAAYDENWGGTLTVPLKFNVTKSQ